MFYCVSTVFLFYFYPVSALHFDVEDKNIGYQDTVFTVYCRNFCLHHPVFQLKIIIGCLFITIFNYSSFFYGRYGKLELHIPFIDALSYDKVVFGGCLYSFTIFQIVGISFQIVNIISIL